VLLASEGANYLYDSTRSGTAAAVYGKGVSLWRNCLNATRRGITRPERQQAMGIAMRSVLHTRRRKSRWEQCAAVSMLANLTGCGASQLLIDSEKSICLPVANKRRLIYVEHHHWTAITGSVYPRGPHPETNWLKRSAFTNAPLEHAPPPLSSSDPSPGGGAGTVTLTSIGRAAECGPQGPSCNFPVEMRLNCGHRRTRRNQFQTRSRKGVINWLGEEPGLGRTLQSP
jgi:hypothetical protein